MPRPKRVESQTLRALLQMREVTSGTDSLAKYISLNARFHDLLVDLAQSPMVRRAVDRAVALPFASPSAFLMGHAKKKEGREIVTSRRFTIARSSTRSPTGSPPAPKPSRASTRGWRARACR